MGERVSCRPVGVHQPQVLHGRARRAAHVRDPLAIRRPGRVGLLGVDVRDALRARPVRANDVDVSIADERDRLPIGRPGGMRVTRLAGCERCRSRPVCVHDVDVRRTRLHACVRDFRRVGRPRRVDLEEDRVALGRRRPASRSGGARPCRPRSSHRSRSHRPELLTNAMSALLEPPPPHPARETTTAVVTARNASRRIHARED